MLVSIGTSRAGIGSLLLLSLACSESSSDSGAATPSGQGGGVSASGGSESAGESASGGAGAPVVGGQGGDTWAAGGQAPGGAGGTGGEATGGEATGGEATGGEATGGQATAGESTGGMGGETMGGTGGEAVGGGGDGGSGAVGGIPELTWSTAEPCPLARFEANGAVVDGELWVMGGFTASSLAVTRRVDIYDPATDSWRPGPDLPGAETHIAAVTQGSDIVIAGGFSGAFVGGARAPTTGDVWRLSAGASQWSEGPALPTRGAAFAWALLGTELHVAGGLGPDGETDADVHYVWDLSGAAEWSTAPPLPTLRNHGGGGSAAGLFFALAGRVGWNESTGAVADVEAFDPASRMWEQRALIPGSRSEIGASTSSLPDGRILVIGGSRPGIVPSEDVLLYDPFEDEWATLKPLPERRKGAVAAPIGDVIVVTTGSPTSTDPSATTFVGCCL